MSYGAVELALEALGRPISKTAAHYAVQAAGEKVPGLRRDDVKLPAGKDNIVAIGADLTSVKCKGEWLSVAVSVDAQERLGNKVTIERIDAKAA